MLKKLILPACFSISLFGCTSLMLPSFDGGVLNPDIRFLRSGEVMSSVKCALIAFQRERDAQLIREREEIFYKRSKDPKKFLLYYYQEYPKNFYKKSIRPAHWVIGEDGDANEFRPWAVNVPPRIALMDKAKKGSFESRVG